MLRSKILTTAVAVGLEDAVDRAKDMFTNAMETNTSIDSEYQVNHTMVGDYINTMKSIFIYIKLLNSIYAHRSQEKCYLKKFSFITLKFVIRKKLAFNHK